ncbi:MAG: hypothetical protein ACRDLK_09595, partial [Gaiellaceae bacterium]
MLNQLAGIYRDGDLITASLQRAYHEQTADRPRIEEQQQTVAEEIRRGERALDRYYQAFESGDLEPGRFKTRLAGLQAKLDTLHDQERSLASQLADPTESFDAQALATVAD